MRGGLQNAGAYDRGRFMISNETKARVIRPVQVLSIVFFSFAAFHCVADFGEESVGTGLQFKLDILSTLFPEQLAIHRIDSCFLQLCGTNH